MLKQTLALVGLTLSLASNASTIETFDTSTDMNAVLNLDVIDGDSGTQWRDAPHAGFATPSLHFNSYHSPNSISLKDTSLEILSFDFREYSHESSVGNMWTWSFYDANLSLLATLGYTNTGDSSIQHMDIAALAYGNVFAVRLEHVNGWMNIDNLEYDAISSVPVPAAAWLFGSALIGLAGIKRKN